jgi:hypothetical protein
MISANELFKRVESLTPGPTLDLAAHIGDFHEIERAFMIPNTKLWLSREGRCTISLDDGGSLEVVGALYVKQAEKPLVVLQFHRHIRLGPGHAEHKWLKVEPWCRGVGISSAFLLRSFELYDGLGVDRVEVEAHMETGKWHWARVGFEFQTPRDLERVRDYAREAIQELRLDGAPQIDDFSSATQFALMTARQSVSLEELAAALPHRREQAEAAARKNSLAMDDPLPLGRLVMLTGPIWNGYLDLNGPERAQFKAYADSKAEEAARLLAPDDPSFGHSCRNLS